MSLSVQVDSQLDGDGDLSNKSAGRWTQEEHNLFLQGLQTHQKQWKLIADMVKTRTVVQIRTHAQKYFQKLNKTSGGGANWNKFDKSDGPSSPFSDQDGQRSFAYPVADSRANSFCSSGDSVDSNGTSAEGNDSEGEVHGQRVNPAGGPAAKPLRLNMPAGGMYGYDPSGSSGHTSTANSNLNSPTAAGHSTFLMAQMHQQQLKRQSQLNAAKAKGGGELVRKRSRESIKTMIPADGARPAPFSPKKGTYDPHFTTNMKAKPDPDVHPSRVHGATGAGAANVAFRASMFNNNNGQLGTAPGPLCGLPDDLGAGMGLGLDVTASDLLFSSFPDDPSCSYSSYGHLACQSNDTDLTNPYFSHHPSGCSVGSSGIAQVFDDADLADILGTIDWDEPVPTHMDSLSSTSTNSRPLSPSTDTSSSVGTAPYLSMSYGARSAAGPTMTIAAMSPKKIPSPIPSSQCVSALAQSLASSQQQPAGNNTNTDDTPVVKKHRVAFSNVLEELELVSEAVRGSNSSSGSHGGAQSNPGDADHISLFDLFQRDATQSVGRLPPLRALVEQARERRGKMNPSAGAGPGTSMGVGCADTSARYGAADDAQVNASSSGAAVDFDAHEFDFGSLMDDDAHPMDCSCSIHFDAHHQHNGNGGFHTQSNMASLSANSALSAPASASRATSGDLFNNGGGILDASGAINPVGGALLNITMMPSTGGLGSAPSSATNTPAVVQRKRGRPRKHSITAPGAPVGTPGAATAKSLLPALSQGPMHGGQFQGHSLPDGQGYIVPVNPHVAQAYSYAVNSSMTSSSGHAEPVSGAYTLQNARSLSTDSNGSVSFRLSLNSNNGFAASGNYFGPDIRLGMSRTMSTESDTMMAGMFDPKIYDSHDVKLGMLEDFE